MASASGLVYHPPRCCRPRKLAPFRFSRSGFFSIEWNPARAVIRCCAVESGVEGTVLGAAHSKARLPRCCFFWGSLCILCAFVCLLVCIFFADYCCCCCCGNFEFCKVPLDWFEFDCFLNFALLVCHI